MTVVPGILASQSAPYYSMDKIMLSYIALAADCLATAHAGVDKNDCKNYYGDYADLVTCDPGYVPVGLCTVEIAFDCSGHFTHLKYCAETATLQVLLV